MEIAIFPTYKAKICNAISRMDDLRFIIMAKVKSTAADRKLHKTKEFNAKKDVQISRWRFR